MQQVLRSHSLERQGNQLYSDGVLKPSEVAANHAQAEAVVCDRCGKRVHPSNWMKHQQSDHSDDPKPLHAAQKQALLPLAAIRTDGGTQPRAFINGDTAAEYAEAMTEGATFPPLVVFFDGQEYWLADGFHRVNAAKSLAWLELPAEVHQGTQRDAVLYSVGVNATHGLRRTNMDKRRAVDRLLRDAEWAKWSNREIAKRCAVSYEFVNQLRRSLTTVVSDERSYTTKHGTAATMQTGNIGKAFLAPVTRPPGVPPASPPLRYGRSQDDYVDEVPAVQVENPYPSLPPQAGEGINASEADWPESLAGNPYPSPIGLPSQAQSTDSPNTGEGTRALPAAVVATYAHHRSMTNEWYTPVEYVNAAREVMAGIGLDPASCAYANRIVRATTYYDVDTNGLLQSWAGTVFLNPPYGFDDNGDSNVATWVVKLISEFNSGRVTEAVLLVNATTERKWFQPLWQYPICFTDHRIQFYNANGQSSQPTQGNAFVYLGPHKMTFAALFAEFGTVVSRMGV